MKLPSIRPEKIIAFIFRNRDDLAYIPLAKDQGVLRFPI